MYIAKRQDGTFETLVNGYPYHVTEDDPRFPKLAEQYPDLAPGMAIVGEMKTRQVTKAGPVTTVDDDGVEHVEIAEQVETEEYFDGGVLLQDNRGKSGWLNGELFTMQDFGPLPEGFSDTPPASELTAQRLAAIDARLAELDTATIRPMRSLLDGSGTEDDKARLAALEQEAEALREERKGLARIY